MRSNLASIPQYTLYEKCKRRLELAGYYRRVETAHEFFQGNQWGDSPPDNMPRPVVNIIDPIVAYKVSSVSNNGMNLYVESDDEKVQSAFLCKLDEIWEKQDMDNLMYEVLQNSAVAGVSAIYCYFDEKAKDVVCEIKDAREIIFGCEEEIDVEKQEFIMLPYVESVARLKREAEQLGLSQEYIEMIRKDQDDYDDIVDRCVCVLKLWKEDDVVHFCKFTKHVMLVEDQNTGLLMYPISIMPWGENSGNIRGLGEVSKILQNQIEINKNYARRGVSIMDGAYPRIAYLTDMVENPESLGEVGSAIGVSGTNIADVAKAITYLSPVRISTDAETYTAELIELTRALAGASDNSIGLVNPEAASGTAILAVQNAQAMPLTRQVAKMRKFIEKLGRIWLELYAVYLPKGFADKDGKKISKSQIEDAMKNLKVEIVSKNPFTTAAVETALGKYLEAGHITFEEYCKLLPHGSVGATVLKNYSPQVQSQKASDSDILQSMNKLSNIGNGTLVQNQNGTAQNVDSTTLFDKVAQLSKKRWSGKQTAKNTGDGNVLKSSETKK